jgi:hypothetical protein
MTQSTRETAVSSTKLQQCVSRHPLGGAVCVSAACFAENCSSTEAAVAAVSAPREQGSAQQQLYCYDAAVQCTALHCCHTGTSAAFMLSI